ncbi:hypothetical protein FA95DRAFT_1562478 [Auriscalpium vulgare]|uniref:Uncharacterized protein n=1 Tax=Auriscalpium vulgare TaxID=40419 RepID=A0ACB8RKQ0_9AGAM|nr:hypothetical protein FA95DRAFT_1562478 [Auriscalpium vulgare]
MAYSDNTGGFTRPRWLEDRQDLTIVKCRELLDEVTAPLHYRIEALQRDAAQQREQFSRLESRLEEFMNAFFAPSIEDDDDSDSASNVDAKPGPHASEQRQVTGDHTPPLLAPPFPSHSRPTSTQQKGLLSALPNTPYKVRQLMTPEQPAQERNDGGDTDSSPTYHPPQTPPWSTVTAHGRRLYMAGSTPGPRRRTRTLSNNPPTPATPTPTDGDGSLFSTSPLYQPVSFPIPTFPIPTTAPRLPPLSQPRSPRSAGGTSGLDSLKVGNKRGMEDLEGEGTTAEPRSSQRRRLE